MKAHIEILGWINIVSGALGTFAALMVFVVFAGLAPFVDGASAPKWLLLIGIGVGGFLFLLSLPTIVAGVGLLQGKPWARLLTLILSAFALFNFPIGTLIAIYAFWVLTQPETAALPRAPA